MSSSSEDSTSDWNGSSSEDESDLGHPKTKKQKILVGEDDRLSDFPDTLIHHILSFLPAEDSIKTGVLSTRWCNLWTAVPKLTFNYSGKRPHEKFFEFVYKTLVQYSPYTIKELVFSFERYVKDRNLDPNIDLWLHWACQQGASEISLELSQKDGHPYRMPQFLFYNCIITKLVSISCLYRPVVDICWESLRSLSIEGVELKSDVLQRILLGSPTLESLSLSNCSNLHGIDISSSLRLEYLNLKKCQHLASLVIGSCSKLETLVLESIVTKTNAKIEIDCPSLKTLKIKGRWEQRMCRLLDVSSLTNAFLDFEVSVASEARFDLVNEMLQKVDHAKQITLGPWIIQAFSVSEFQGLPSPWTNCQHLTLLADFDKWTISVTAMISLLLSLPILQTLVLYNSKNCSHKRFCSDSINEEDVFQEKHDLGLSCLPGHLKSLKIVCPNLDFDQTGLIAIVQFLVGNAKVLEKLVLVAGKCEPYFKVFDLQQKFSSLPRSSPYVQVLTLPCSE